MFGSTLPDAAKASLAVLGKSGLVKNAYLAGGSALALHFGHRYSVDLDFFSPHLFDPRRLSRSLSGIGHFDETIAKGISLIGELDSTKLSYFGYEYPLIGKLTPYLGVNIASVKDIASMKLVALMDRGTKRDFVDIFEIISHGTTVEELFGLYDKKYGTLETNLFSLIKSMQYFDEAEDTQMPKMIKKINWEKVKEFFSKESLRLVKKYLN